jgi:hypothetical protein
MSMRELRPCFVSIALVAAFTLTAQPAAHDATEAAKVASWLRSAAPASPGASFFGVLGGMSSNFLGPAEQTVRTSGPAALYANASALAAAKQSLTQRGTNYLPLLAAAGIRDFRDVQNVPWGLIEVARGEFHYDLLDTMLAAAAAVDGNYVGTVMPYAGWELKAANYPLTTVPMCQTLLTQDFYYLQFDGRMDRYRDEAEYLKFLAAVVERYDGDGVSDAPDVPPIKLWQIHNEPEGDRCGLFREDVAGFVRLMQVSADVIHQSCSDCLVMNGGAAASLFLENRVPVPGGVNFWRDFAAMGGAGSVDVIAAHYNQGKDPDHGNIDDFEYQVRRIRELLGQSKPVWMTEFGSVIGTGTNFSGLTEAQAGAWFMRFYAAGIAAGVDKFISDASAFVTLDGTVYLPFYVNKLIDTTLGGFTAAEKVATGQYRFTVRGSDVYVTWNGVPAALHGTIVATDMYGTRTTAEASTFTPSEASPLILQGRGAARTRAVRR